MSSQRFGVLALLCGMLVLNGGVDAVLTCLGALASENGEAGIAVDSPRGSELATDSIDGDSVRDTSSLDEVALPISSIASASTCDPARDGAEESACSPEITLPSPHEISPPMWDVSLFTPDQFEEHLKPAAHRVETPDQCLAAEICIDNYLWSIYDRTPKVDTNKLTERIETKIKKKGKTRTVIKTITKYVVGDFTWKDPIAAQRAGMSLKEYVIGGMDRGFKLKLFQALRTMDEAGFMPGITSAFRDDYRQSIAAGNRAASDSSYHGGSRRGGYGHGLAVDIVSVKGETRLQRFAATVELWKWIDANERELGIGRPYLDRDPPHVGPIDGKEYADKRGGATVKTVRLATVRPVPLTVASNSAVMNSQRKKVR